MNKHAIIYTDGGARGNPGPAGIGAVIKYNGKVKKFKEYIGVATNNQAEYKAILMGLIKAKEFGTETIDAYLDSELVVNQLNQKYKVKNKELASLFVKAWNLTLNFKEVKFMHVYREDNKEADRLVNEAIDEYLKG